MAAIFAPCSIMGLIYACMEALYCKPRRKLSAKALGTQPYDASKVNWAPDLVTDSRTYFF